MGMEQIESWLAAHEEEMVADIQSLVRVRSVAGPATAAGVYGGGCAEALRVMLEIGRRCGFKTEDHDGRCGSILYENGPKTIGMWGHLDVVPEGEGWIYPPYGAQRVGDFLIGRGVQDNKGPAVAALYAMRCMKELRLLEELEGTDGSARCSIRQVVGCNEENGMDDVEYYLERWKAPDFSFVTDSGFPVCHGEKGILTMTLTSAPLSGAVKELKAGQVTNVIPDSALAVIGARTFTADGMSGHAAFPGTSVNAVGVLCHALAQAGVLGGYDGQALSFIGGIASTSYGEGLGIQCEDEVSGKLTCAGSVLRLTDGRAVLSLDIRYPVTVKAETLLQKIEKICAAQRFDMAVTGGSAPSFVPAEHPCVQALMKVYHEETNAQDKPFVMGGGTYARKIPHAVAFGPGMKTDLSPLALPAGHGGGHSPDEAQSIPNLLKAAKIYARALLALNGIV